MPRKAHLRISLGSITLFLFLLLLGACTGSATLEQTTVEQVTEAQPAFEPTALPQATPETQPSSVAPAVTPTSAPPVDEIPSAACEDVPRFQAADTVSIACSGAFAVSPELFANNAGWHLFQAQDGVWQEVDYARTCCESDDPSFIELLARNGLDASIQDALCTGSGLASDPFSGCAEDEVTQSTAEFEATWLRVNGLGDHDFGVSTDIVLESISQTFGRPDAVVEASECGAGPMTIASFDDFTVQFQEGVFIGWYYASSTPQLTTPSGVAVGISEADLRVVYQGVEIFDESLGREFFFEVPAGFMAGFISETDATVTALYAGTNCFFR